MAVPRWLVATAVAGTFALGAAACGSDGDAAQEQTRAPAAADTTSSTNAMKAPATVVDIAASDTNFSTLVKAVQTAGLGDTLSGAGPFTVFAPGNGAFAALPAGTVDSLLKPENKDQLKSILTYHVVPGKAMSGQLTDDMTVTTVQGQNLTINVDGGNVKLTDASGKTVSVVKADVEAGNGVVHVIDGVLLPAAG